MDGNFGEKLKINFHGFMARHVHVNLILQMMKYTHIPMKLVQGLGVSMSSCHERLPHLKQVLKGQCRGRTNMPQEW